MSCSGGQGRRSGCCIDVVAPWPRSSRGGSGAIQLHAACVHGLTSNLSPPVNKGLHWAPFLRASSQLPLRFLRSQVHTRHDLQLSFSTFLLWNKVNTLWRQRWKERATIKKQKRQEPDFDELERKYQSLMKWHHSSRILSGCRSS